MGDAWPILLLLLLASGGEDVPRPNGDVLPHASGDRARLRCAFKATGLGNDWLRFFEQVARRESGRAFNNAAKNERPKEAAAARTAAVRNWTERRTLEPLGWSLDDWSFGSGGWFGQLPANNLGIFTDDYIRRHGPWAVFNMGASMAMAVGFARGLMGWKNFGDSWASLDVGWGYPGNMGKPDKIAEHATKIEDRAAGLGYARGWAMQRPSRPASLTREQWVALGHAAQLRAETCEGG